MNLISILFLYLIYSMILSGFYLSDFLIILFISLFFAVLLLSKFKQAFKSANSNFHYVSYTFLLIYYRRLFMNFIHENYSWPNNI